MIPLQARVAQRVGRGIALLFHDCGTGRGWVVSSTPWPYFTPGKDPVPILQETGWAPGPVWTGGKSRPHRDSIRTVQPVISRYTDWATRPTYKPLSYAIVGMAVKFGFHFVKSGWVTTTSFLLSYLIWPLLPNHCGCRVYCCTWSYWRTQTHINLHIHTYIHT